MLDSGTRVNTPHGPGSILYKRMKFPDYTEIDCYSVCLDTKKAESNRYPFPFYSGTIVPAEQVEKI